MYRTCLAITLTALACSLACGVRADDKLALKDALALEEALQDVIKQAEPSIACILVSRSDAYQKLFGQEPPRDNPGQLGTFNPASVLQKANPFPHPDDSIRKKCDLSDPDNVPEAYGSGVVIDSAKLLILTNYHVVRDATKIYVRLPHNKGSYANIHAADPRSDLAVLRLLLDESSIRPLKELKFGDGGSARKGQFVVSLANPFAAGFRDGSPSASWGILSNVHRRAAGSPEENRQKVPLHVHATLLQTDARLNLGCSGGALLNLNGELIGLTTSRAAISGSETAGGFAIPLDANMKRIIARLRAGMEVEYGFLGVVPDAGSRHGESFCIGHITSRSPADKAGLKPGEHILSVNGVRVRDFEDLVLTVGTLMAGSEARLEIQNQNHSRRTVPVTLAKYYVPGKIIASKRPAAVRGFRVDYTSVLMMQLSSQVQQPPIHPGVFVCEVQSGSPAAAKLKVSDVITEVKIREVITSVNTPDEFYRAVEKLPPGEPLSVLLGSREWLRID